MNNYYIGDAVEAIHEVETSIFKLYFAFKKAGYIDRNIEKSIRPFINVIIDELFQTERKGEQK